MSVTQVDPRAYAELLRQTLPTVIHSEERIIVTVKKGVLVPIRLDDPSQLVASHEGVTTGAHVLIGAPTDRHLFIPASVVSHDATGRTYQTLIPFDRTVNVSVASAFFQLIDQTNTVLPKTGTKIPVMVPSGQQPAAISLRVSAVAPK
jgi:hypothetical protein